MVAVYSECVYARGMKKKQPAAPKKTKTSDHKLMYTIDFQANTRRHETSQTKHQKFNKKVKQIDPIKVYEGKCVVVEPAKNEGCKI